MNRKIRVVGSLGVVLVTALLVATTAGGSGAQPNGSSNATSPNAGVSSPVARPGVAGSGMACPAVAEPALGLPCGPTPVAWCCPGGWAPGITVTGQATLKGEGTKIRDQAIAQAVADAKDQAETAAGAAGVKLGQILMMQIGSSGYPYPVEAVAIPSAGGGQTGVASPSCPPGARCPAPAPQAVWTFVSVTVTWAIG